MKDEIIEFGLKFLMSYCVISIIHRLTLGVYLDSGVFFAICFVMFPVFATFLLLKSYVALCKIRDCVEKGCSISQSFQQPLQKKSKRKQNSSETEEVL